jgi:hypothetical protein
VSTQQPQRGNDIRNRDRDHRSVRDTEWNIDDAGRSIHGDIGHVNVRNSNERQYHSDRERRSVERRRHGWPDQANPP